LENLTCIFRIEILFTSDNPETEIYEFILIIIVVFDKGFL